MAEKVGLGISTGSTFTLKKDLRDEISSICIPNITKKEMIGTITHVSMAEKMFYIMNKNPTLFSLYILIIHIQTD